MLYAIFELFPKWQILLLKIGNGASVLEFSFWTLQQDSQWQRKIIGWNVIISKDRAQKGKRKAKAAAAIADGWNIKDKPYQALS